MDMPPVRYTRTTGGVRIAYGIHAGTGRQRLSIPGPGSPTLSMAHLVPGNAAMFDAAWSGRPITRFDFRGTGLSGPTGDELTLMHQVSDIAAVTEAVGEEMDVAAFHWSCFPAVAFAATSPPLWRSLVLVDPGLAGNTYPVGPMVDLQDELSELHFKEMFLRYAWDVTGTDSTRLARLWNEEVPPRVGRMHMAACQSADIRESLPRVRIPVLVITEPTFQDAAAPVAERLPNASLAMIDSFEASARVGTWMRRTLDDFYARIGDSPASSVSSNAGLSPRELDVLRLLATGRSNRKIAASLVLSEATVATHVRHILGKTGSANRVEAANWAREHGVT